MTDQPQSFMDTASVPAPPGSAPASQRPDYLTKYAGQMEDLQRQDQEAFNKYETALAPRLGALSKSMGSIPKPPEQQKVEAPPRPEDYQKNALGWASAMAVLGAVSSKFTRNAGNAALNAFAGALKGWKEGNQQAYHDAAQQWEQANKQTLENNRMILDKYKQVLQNRKMNIDEQMANIQLLATQYHDKMTFDAAASKNYTLVAQIYEKNQEYTDRANEYAQKMQETREKQQGDNEQKASYWLSPRGQKQLQTLSPSEQASVQQMISIATNKGQRITPEQADAISQGIVSGDQPPVLTGLYGSSGAVRADLEAKGFNLTEAQMEWQRAQKQIQTLNGPQMTRFVGLANSVTNTIDEVRNLSKQMQLSGVPALNSAELTGYIQSQGNSPNGQLATRYVAAVNTLKSEFANLEAGGYAPHEAVWSLANQQVNGNYGVKQLDAALTEIQRLINYRVNAIPGLGTFGAGAPNRYTGQGQQAADQTAPPAQSNDGWGEVKVH